MGHFLVGEDRQETLQKWRLLELDGLMGIDVIPFIGHGTGATKTTTVLDGLAIAEQMTIGDQLYLLWHFPHHLDRTKDIVLEIGWYLNASESGKLISGDIDFGFMNGGLVTDTTGVFNMVDEPAPSTAYESKSTSFTFPLSTYLVGASANAGDMHIRLTRVASSNDPVAHPRLHHMSVMYWKKHL